MDLASKMSDTMEIEEWDNGNGLNLGMHQNVELWP